MDERGRAKLLTLGLMIAFWRAAASVSFAQAPPSVTPPVAQSSTDVPYPEEAEGDASVWLELTIDETGRVTDASVIEGSEPFAERARTASLAWSFLPARRADSPVAARIRARVDFHRQEVLAPPPSAAPPLAAAPAPSDPPPIEVTVHGQRLHVGQTTISAEEVRVMPGAFGDAFRAIEGLPGVTPVVSGAPYFYVRGAPPNDNSYYVDGVRVPFLFHLGIGQGVVHSGLIDGLDFFPNAAPARYPGSVGAVIAARTREPAPHFRGELNLRLLDAGALLETPLDEGRGSALVAGHYGYPGPILSALASEMKLGYWDYQTRATWRVGERDTLGVFAFGSHDYLGTLHFGREVELLGSDFHRVDLRYDRALSDGRVRAAATLGYDAQGGALDSDAAPIEMTDLSGVLRLEIDDQLTPALRLQAGADARLDRYRFEQGTSAPRPSGAMLPKFPSSADPPPLNITAGAHTEVAWRLTDWLELTPGVRVTLFESSRGGTRTLKPALDPRLSARVTLTPAIAWLSQLGLSHQYPTLRVSSTPAPLLSLPGFALGRSQLQSALQASQAIELTLPADIMLTVTGFFASWTGLTDLTANCLQIMPASMPRVGTGEGPPPENGYHCPGDHPVTGRAYGLEFLLRRSLSKRLSGWLSYTLSRSTRRAHFLTLDGGDAVASVASDFDRTHVLSAVLAYDFGLGWRSGARFVFYTGAPYSNLNGNVPVPPYNALRAPAFYRVDVRLEKRWRIGTSGSIAFVLEGQNVTLSKEVSGLGTDCIGDVTPDAYTTRCKPAKIGPLTLPSVGVEAFF